MRVAFASVGALAAATILAACVRRGPRDVENQHPRSEFTEVPTATAPVDAGPPRVPATPTATGRRPRVLVRGGSHAIALDARNVYFGSDADDALLALPKQATDPPSEPTRIARHAPTNGALSLDTHDGTLAWVGSPGDVVLRVAAKGGTPSTVRDRGIFADVVATGGDVFVTEALGTGGVLTRVTGATSARLGSFEGTPRGLAVDAERAYVATSSRLVSFPRTRGEATELATQASFASPQVDDDTLYATAVTHGTRARSLVAVPKHGGPLETVATDVRDAPIAVANGVVYWFEAERPNLLALDLRASPRPPARVVSVDPVFEHVSALAVDESGVYAAVGRGDDACIVIVALQ
jgi:hypothetical protein